MVIFVDGRSSSSWLLWFAQGRQRKRSFQSTCRCLFCCCVAICRIWGWSLRCWPNEHSHDGHLFSCFEWSVPDESVSSGSMSSAQEQMTGMSDGKGRKPNADWSWMWLVME